MANLEKLPDTITIPGKPEEVDSSRVRGDIRGGISYEISEASPDFSQVEAVREGLEHGDRVFRTKDGDYVFVLSENQAEVTGETVLIPGRPVVVDIEQTRGDRRSGIRFEIRPEYDWISSLAQGQEVLSTLENGGRAFITENDDLLFVNPLVEGK